MQTTGKITKLSKLEMKENFRIVGDSERTIYRVANRTEQTVHYWKGRAMMIVWVSNPQRDFDVERVQS